MPATRPDRTPAWKAAEPVVIPMRTRRQARLDAAHRHARGLYVHLAEIGMRGEASAVATLIDYIELSR